MVVVIVGSRIWALHEGHVVEGAAYLKLSKSPAAAGLAF